MYKTILVPGLNALCRESALELATQVARQCDARIEYLHVHPDSRELARYASTLDMQSSMFSSQIWEAMVEGDKICAVRARKAFDTFCAREKLSGEGAVSAVFRESDGNAAERIAAEARYSDLVVLGRPEQPEDLAFGEAGEILIDGGRPLLLAPSRPCANPITTVAVAWKESATSVHAVTAALPLLKKATKIHIVGVAERDDEEAAVRASCERLAEMLRRHGLRPVAGVVRSGGRDPCEILLETASQKLEAGVLVMGGYGHSRAREFIFGGFTRAVLHGAPLPVLLAH